MGSGIVATFYLYDTEYDQPIFDEHLQEIKGNTPPTPAIERANFHATWFPVYKLLLENYEGRIRYLSYDKYDQHDIDYAFILVDNFENGEHMAKIAKIIGRAQNVFIFHDLNSFFLTPYALPFLKYYKDKIDGLIVHNPDIADIVEKVTGIKTLLLTYMSHETEKVTRNLFKITSPQKELLVVGGVNERGGYIANSFAEYHFKGNYDVIHRHTYTDIVKVLPGCRDVFSHTSPESWRELVHGYKYVIDGTGVGCTVGRIGWDAFCLGRSFISVKNRSYTSYLFDRISINSELDMVNWEDIGWKKAHQLAEDRLVTEEEMQAAWSEVL